MSPPYVLQLRMRTVYPAHDSEQGVFKVLCVEPPINMEGTSREPEVDYWMSK